MSYGMYVAASGVLTSMYRQDVYANNLANLNTAAFKPDAVGVVARDAARVEDGLGYLPSNSMLERLGAGTLMGANIVQFTQGSIETTGNPLDIAIEGEGFFVTLSGEGTDQQRVRLMRDGRFTLDPQGKLVTANEGFAVLDQNDRPIYLDTTEQLEIGSDGTIRQNGEYIGAIQFAQVPDQKALRKIGSGQYTADPSVIASRRSANGALVQRAIEKSAVDPITTLMGLTSAARAVASNARNMSFFDELQGTLLSRFGRI